MSRLRSANPTESRRKRSASDPHEATVSAVTAVGLARKRHSLAGRPVVYPPPSLPGSSFKLSSLAETTGCH